MAAPKALGMFLGWETKVLSCLNRLPVNTEPKKALMTCEINGRCPNACPDLASF